MSHRCNRNFWDRRDFLFRSGGGISGLALAYLLDQEGLLRRASDAAATDGATPPRSASTRTRRSRRISRRARPR